MTVHACGQAVQLKMRATRCTRVGRLWHFTILTLYVLAGGAAASQESPLLSFQNFGTFEYRTTTNGLLVAAPHGTSDTNTDRLAMHVAASLGAGYVVARGFELRASILTPWRTVRINVNRPTEESDFTGIPCDKETPTARAREVFHEYQRLVTVASGRAPLRLYVELHANGAPQTRSSVEIASKGISALQARRVKDAYPRIQTSIAGRWPWYIAPSVLIEPIDRLYFGTDRGRAPGCTNGILASPTVTRALHFEFPDGTVREEALPASALLAQEVIRIIAR